MKTDSQIQQDVSEELDWEPSVDATQIGVEVKDGIVTLAGHVTSFAEKWNAELAVQRVSGVKALAVEIDVILPGSSQRNDVDIARAAENLLTWTSNVPKDRVKIMVEGGWVTLSGEVDWEYQRLSITRDIRHLMGVVGVSDQIFIKPQASLDTIKSGIKAALERRVQSDVQSISVDVLGNCVTLSGPVFSWSERDLAEYSAWSAPGVRSVINNITIAC
jgi:osmotically-inducible protein OsmY